MLGEQWAKVHDIPIKGFAANWYPEGMKGGLDSGAGFRRNVEMAVYADALLAIWDGSSSSPGTKHMIDTARLHGLRLVVKIWLAD